MINSEAVKSRILLFIGKNGPSLPIQIAKEIGMNSIFASAFLSELLDAKKIKTSSLRVGGTTLYLIPGQEPMLEKFHSHLHPKEVEAYESLKEKKILKDSDQEPAIRVALRSIKDFAFSFKSDEEIYWRYLTVTEPEVREIFQKKVSKYEEERPKEEKITKEDSRLIKEEAIEEKLPEKDQKMLQEIIEKPKIEPEKTEEKQKKKKIKEPQISISDFENPLAVKEIKQEKIKPKSEFVEKVIKFLEENKFKIINEIDYKAKEYNCIAEIETRLGPISFLTQVKDKKSVSDTDLNLILRQAQSIPLPALYISPGSLNKKAQEYQNKYYSILKTLKLE